MTVFSSLLQLGHLLLFPTISSQKRSQLVPVPESCRQVVYVLNTDLLADSLGFFKLDF